MDLIYLAAPYAHPDPQVRATRVELVNIATALLMDRGFAVHSPLTQGEAVRQHLPGGDRPHGWWLARDKRVLAGCSAMFVLPLEGWGESRGVWEELDFCDERDIPVRLISHLPEPYQHHVTLPAQPLLLRGFQPFVNLAHYDN